jgi:hypothetical protein
MGLLQPTSSLVLAAGTHRRYVIRHTLVNLSPVKWESVPAARIPIGLGHHASLRSPRTMLEEQLEQLLSELKLDPGLFQSERLLTAEEAVKSYLADTVVTHPLLPTTPAPEPIHETNR